MKNKKILIVSYYWFPQSGTGVYRISKLVKFLKRAGWEPIVLTASKALSSYQEKEIEDDYKDVKVYRTKIFEPTSFLSKDKGASNGGFNAAYVVAKNKSLKQKIIVWIRTNLFIPDAKRFWKYHAVKEGKKLIRKENPALILSTSPPPTTHLIAKKLAKWSKLKWIADFRDPWTNIYYYESLNINPISKALNKSLERKVLYSADRIVMVSDNFFTGVDIDEKTIRIENGFDPDDFTTDIVKQDEKNGKFKIRYIGTLKQNQFFKNFLSVLKELEGSEKYKGKIDFEIIGFVDPEIKEFIDSLGINIKYSNYLPHKEAVQKMAESDLLILAIGREEINKMGISTKIFEYMMVKKPILAFGHVDGMADQILRETQAGKLFSYENSNEVREYITQQINNGGKVYSPNSEAISYYSFKNLTEQYIDQIEDVLKIQ